MAVQRLLGKLIVVQEERADSWRVARALDTSPVVQAVRRLAPRHGFERLGVQSERLAFQGLTIFSEVWANAELGVYLSTTEGFYTFTTYFRDGTELITRSLSAPATQPSSKIAIHACRGGFEANLTAHLGRIRERENSRRQAIRACSLEARVELDQEHYRSRMRLPSLLSLLGTCLVFPILPLVWASVVVTVGLASGAPLLTPLLGVLTYVALNGLLYLTTPKHPQRDAVAQSLARELRPVLRVRPTKKACPEPAVRPTKASLHVVSPRAKGTATRCPFCHAAVHETGVACTQCLARHHGDCWDLHARCATCASPHRLVDEAGRDSHGPDAVAA